jgi:hypothetical protein
MNKVQALEAWKIQSVLEDFIGKLNFLEQLKSGGEGDSEAMSEEITKAMND